MKCKNKLSLCFAASAEPEKPEYCTSTMHNNVPRPDRILIPDAHLVGAPRVSSIIPNGHCIYLHKMPFLQILISIKIYFFIIITLFLLFNYLLLDSLFLYLILVEFNDFLNYDRPNLNLK